MTVATRTASIADELANTAFFSAFARPVLERLEGVSAHRRYKKNTRVISAGDDAQSAFVLVKGDAVAFTEDDEGNEFIVNTFEAGDCFGELGLLDNQPRTAHVTLTTDSICIVIPKVEFRRCIESDPEAVNSIIADLVQRIRTLTDDVSCLALLDVYGRISRLLQQSAVAVDEGPATTPKMTHKQIASRVGSSREMVSKILKELAIGGYIKSDNQQITLLKKLPDKW